MPIASLLYPGVAKLDLDPDGVDCKDLPVSFESPRLRLPATGSLMYIIFLGKKKERKKKTIRSISIRIFPKSTV